MSFSSHHRSARSLDGAVCIPQIGPVQSIEVARNRTLDGPRRRISTLRVSIVISLPEEKHPPGRFSSGRNRIEPRAGGGRAELSSFPAHHRNRMKPVVAFVVAMCDRHHPLSRDTAIPLPCRTEASSRSSYLRHSPRVRGLNYLADFAPSAGNHSGTHTPSPIIGDLPKACHVARGC